MRRTALALGAWLVLMTAALVPDLAAQDPASGQKSDKVTEQAKEDKKDTGSEPVKMGTPETKLQKFCAQDENKSHDKCAAGAKEE
ncbi:MAG: hypothetical protein AAGF86_15185 [Pseudomonadota bacterium]